MSRSIRAASAAVVVAGAMTLFGAPTIAEAQRALPRVGVAAPPQQPSQPTGRAGQAPGVDQRNDPRYRPDQWSDPRYRPDHGSADPRYRQRPPYGGGSKIIYVPVPYGYGYNQGAYYPPNAYYPPITYGNVYDANGRPLSAPIDQVPPAGGSAVYTPDLSGSPYSVTNEGMMLVEFDSGERRAFPSCAEQTATRDPQGRPRTIFYQPSDYWLVLKPGQRGRVQGTPPAGATACYAADTVGRMVLRY